MTLLEITYFTEVYQQKSIARVADKFFVSSQAVSKSIKNLEKEFGVSLFTTVGNKLHPTEAGTIFYNQMIKILNILDITKQELSSFSAKTATTKKISINLCESVASCYTDIINDALHTKFPNLLFDYNVDKGVSNDIYAYSNYDISLLTVPNNFYSSYLDRITDNFGFILMKEYPSYVWLSSFSHLNKYDILNSNLLKNYQPLVYNNIFNSVDPKAIANLSSETQNIKSQELFIRYLETGNYYATDLPLNQGKLLYSEMLEGKKVCAKKMEDVVSLILVYNKESAANYITTLLDIKF